ncbi:hypothetical protein M513_13223 [Trichuris suis]|uniref:Uncharacterized protein n=1 Tax=Trichuris suis TaxID=68888 RepID=A0A085LLN9_9BILA|nr:hypothetical protein M513_13223 [Trichuris suis]
MPRTNARINASIEHPEVRPAETLPRGDSSTQSIFTVAALVHSILPSDAQRVAVLGQLQLAKAPVDNSSVIMGLHSFLMTRTALLYGQSPLERIPRGYGGLAVHFFVIGKGGAAATYLTMMYSRLEAICGCQSNAPEAPC